MRLNNPSASAVTVLTAVALFIGACGYDSADGYGPTAQPANTATAIATTEVTAATPAPGVELRLIAASVQFDRAALTAPAGPVTIAFDNRDDGVPHNIHVFRGDDASGANVGSTEIQAGAVRQTLVLGSLAAGSYFYQCDVHPSRMMGTLTVS